MKSVFLLVIIDGAEKSRVHTINATNVSTRLARGKYLTMFYFSFTVARARGLIYRGSISRA